MLRFLLLLAGLLLAFVAPAQLPPGASPARLPPVIDWKAPTTLGTYLLQQVQVQAAARQAEVTTALASPAGAATYRDSARARFGRVLGPLPAATTPLRAQVVGRVPQAGFVVEKVVYESRPHHHVTASLYLPTTPGRHPAALLACGHEPAAKATPSYQLTARLLARNGFVVLVPDPVSQGERLQVLDAAGRPLTRGGTTEHTLLNAAAALLGQTLPAAELHDNRRGLDYLLSRPEVDGTRLAALGNSGGATQAAYLAAYDPRVAAVALCSYVASGARNLTLTGPADGCVQLPGAGAAHLDVADWLLMAAPRPLLLLTGRYDFVDQTDMEAAWAEARRFYTALGIPERLGLYTYDDGHGISAPKREQAVRWLRRWLGAPGEYVPETSLTVLSEAALRCTPTGQVGTAFADEQLLPALYRAEAARLAARRGSPAPAALTPWLSGQLAPVPGTLAATAAFNTMLAGPGAAPTTVEIRDTLRRPDGQQWQGLLLRCPGQPPLPLRRLLPAPGQPTPTRQLLWLPDAGLAAVLQDSAARLAAYQRQGTAVLLADLRGLGETADPPALNDPKYYNQEYRVAQLALHTGRSLPAQRALDIGTVLTYAQQIHDQEQDSPGYAPVQLAVRADGRAALPALVAAGHYFSLGPVYTGGGPATFTYYLDNAAAHDAYSEVLPGVLRYLDLPDLRRALGPRLAEAAR